MSDYMELNKCILCPFECNVNRNQGKIGRCKAPKKIKIALYKLHFDEEPCISGKNGSGTIFFSDCNLKCKFCQNYKISCESKGEEITKERLANIMLELQEKKANNINLVTATPYVPMVIDAIKIAKRKGLNIPLLYNTSGYESLETLKMLDGLIDIYLPDFKYFDNELGKRLSNVTNYREITTRALKEMYRQVGTNKYNDEGLLIKGMIIRHLVLPNNIENSKKVLKWISLNMPSNIMISLMAQYFPTYKAESLEEINRQLNEEEYKQIEEYLYSLNLENGYIQELGKEEEKYVPEF